MTEALELVSRADALTFSDPCANLIKALVFAQGKMGDVIKNASNPAFKSKYADLAAVVEAVQPALQEAKIAFIQAPSTLYDSTGVDVNVETRLMHESGEWVKSTLTMRPLKTDPQGVGSAITYARRYALQSLCGVAPADDDGNAASKPGAATTKPEPARAGGAPAPKPDPLAALRSLFARAFEGTPTPPTLGAWLEQGVAKDLRARRPVALTPAEITDATLLLESQIEANAAFANLDVPAREALREMGVAAETSPAPAEAGHVPGTADAGGSSTLPASAAEEAQLAFAETTGADVAPQNAISQAHRIKWTDAVNARKKALAAMYPGVTSQEKRRHAFAAEVLGDPEKASSKTWDVFAWKRVMDRLELIPPDAPS